VGRGGAAPRQREFVSRERWDRQTETFVAGPALATARWGAQVAELGTSTDVIVIGGVDQQNALLTEREVYSGLFDAWIGTVDLQVARHQFRAVTLLDGRVLVVGGIGAQRNGIASTEVHTR